jgi:Fe-S-cluster-containing dehydrogenase component
MAEKPNMAEGMLIDYSYCTGCHSCEISCKQRFDLPSERQGIKIHKHGPIQNPDGSWELNYIPIPTEVCNLCADRRAEGKKARCEQHCQSFVIKVGPLDELVKLMSDHKKQVLYNVTSDKTLYEPQF